MCILVFCIASLKSIFSRIEKTFCVFELVIKNLKTLFFQYFSFKIFKVLKFIIYCRNLRQLINLVFLFFKIWNPLHVNSKEVNFFVDLIYIRLFKRYRKMQGELSIIIIIIIIYFLVRFLYDYTLQKSS